MKDNVKYKYHVFFCTNKREKGHPRGCCNDKSALKLRNLMKLKTKMLGLNNVRINTSGCLDKCEFGPTVVIYPDAVWYSVKNEKDVDDIIKGHLLNDTPVKKLFAFS